MPKIKAANPLRPSAPVERRVIHNMPNTQKAINQTCTYRGLPSLKKGMPCEVDGENGVIFGGNHAANLNVKFNDGRIRNCHPEWRMKVFNSNGDIFYKSDDV